MLYRRVCTCMHMMLDKLKLGKMLSMSSDVTSAIGVVTDVKELDMSGIGVRAV